MLIMVRRRTQNCIYSIISVNKNTLTAQEGNRPKRPEQWPLGSRIMTVSLYFSTFLRRKKAPGPKTPPPIIPPCSPAATSAGSDRVSTPPVTLPLRVSRPTARSDKFRGEQKRGPGPSVPAPKYKGRQSWAGCPHRGSCPQSSLGTSREPLGLTPCPRNAIKAQLTTPLGLEQASCSNPTRGTLDLSLPSFTGVERQGNDRVPEAELECSRPHGVQNRGARRHGLKGRGLQKVEAGTTKQVKQGPSPALPGVALCTGSDPWARSSFPGPGATFSRLSSRPTTGAIDSP